jgi:hypothetical protein
LEPKEFDMPLKAPKHVTSPFAHFQLQKIDVKLTIPAMKHETRNIISQE